MKTRTRALPAALGLQLTEVPQEGFFVEHGEPQLVGLGQLRAGTRSRYNHAGLR